MANKIEPFYVVLGSKIQAAREDRKMTQAQLGRSLTPESTRASIANIENGKQRVLLHTFIQLTRALDVDMKVLLPPTEPVGQAPTTKDVERELRRKLNLATPQLKKLASVSDRPTLAGRAKI
jgi:transcriptional regulator with XRE-family HTH domain